jgi:hypothetical protein
MAVGLWCNVMVVIVYHLQTKVSRRQEKKKKKPVLTNARMTQGLKAPLHHSEPKQMKKS